MKKAIIIRIVRDSGLLITVSFIIFLLLDVLPGSAVEVQLGVNATQESIAALTKQLGLDMPWYMRYLQWIKGFIDGDFGFSHTYRRPVFELITDRLNVSVPLASMALATNILLGGCLGLIAVIAPRKSIREVTETCMQIITVTPNFWLGIFLILLFSVYFGWFPSGGFAEPGSGVSEVIWRLVLPVLAIAVPQAGIFGRMTQTTLNDILKKPFITTAVAKGAGKLHIVFIHALPNAFIPLLTLLSLQFSFLVAGTVIIENVFYLPGLGRLIFQSLTERDLPVIKTIIMFQVLLVITVNLLTNLIIIWCTPTLERHCEAIAK